MKILIYKNEKPNSIEYPKDFIFIKNPKTNEVIEICETIQILFLYDPNSLDKRYIKKLCFGHNYIRLILCDANIINNRNHDELFNYLETKYYFNLATLHSNFNIFSIEPYRYTIKNYHIPDEIKNLIDFLPDGIFPDKTFKNISTALKVIEYSCEFNKKDL